MPGADSSERGHALRAQVPRSRHADWTPPPRRRDPVEVLRVQETERIASLVPVRHGRMLVSPFTFYRGAAAIMAADLATHPDHGLRVQLCGDAHLSNFGVFARPTASSSSTSTTSTRRCRARSSGTSSGSPPASGRGSRPRLRQAGAHGAAGWRRRVATARRCRASRRWRHRRLVLAPGRRRDRRALRASGQRADRKRFSENVAQGPQQGQPARPRTADRGQERQPRSPTGRPLLVPIDQRGRGPGGRRGQRMLKRLFAKYRETLPDHDRPWPSATGRRRRAQGGGRRQRRHPSVDRPAVRPR